VASSAADLALKLQKASAALTSAEKSGVGAAALRMKRTIEGSRDRVTGDGRLSGAGNARLDVQYTLKGEGSASTALMKAKGPWQLVENDTKSAGRVTGKVGRVKGRGSRRANRERDLAVAFGARGALSGVKPIAWPGGPHPFASFRDGPTKGQKPWAKGVERGTPAATEEIRRSSVNAVRNAF